MEITNEQIYIEILKLKKLLHQSLDLQRELVSIEEEIKLFEGKQAEEELKIANAVKRKKFSSIIDWKRAIWDHCPSKREHIGQATITFQCDLTKGTCMYENCPKNFVEELP
jgi:hypothetical protein